MSKSKKHLLHMFTRDFTLVMHEWWHRFAVKGFVRDLGKGLSDQIIRYTGRSSECYRIQEDFDAMRDHLLTLPSSHPLYRPSRHKQFRRSVTSIRSFGKGKDWVRSHPMLYRDALHALEKQYAYFALGVYIPGPWADAFRSQYGKDAEPIIKAFYEDRKRSEGMFEHVDGLTVSIIEHALRERGISTEYTHVVRSGELERMLRGKTAPALRILKERKQGYVLIRGRVVSDQSFQVLLRKHHYVFRPKRIGKQTTTLNGTVAYKAGRIRGVVHTVLNRTDVPSFPKKGILVSPMTVPDFVPAMKRAAAIVTDEGGVTCHAAIVSREMKIPCIIGTKVATKVLKDGDRVEVDATKGVVRKI